VTDREQLAIVVAGGVAPLPQAARGLPPDADVIAADSGLDHARALGLEVNLVVGDMDSVRPESLAAAIDAGAVIEEHPVAKDQTDLELALDRAMERQPSRLVVIGGETGRVDHFLAIALLLASARYAAVPVEARLGHAVLHVVRRHLTFTGRAGDVVTLLPLHGRARGITTEGLVYPLMNEDLVPGTTRGVSNEMAGATASVRLESGVLLVIQPHALA
jgi:thiamine pyrophosphokinase